MAADPLSAVAVGAGTALSNLAILRNLEKKPVRFWYHLGVNEKLNQGYLWTRIKRDH
jgi:hypothetical protein